MAEPKFKSKYESHVYHAALAHGGQLKYEPRGSKMTYVLPPRQYQIDFILANGIHVETKGFLRYDDLRKMVAVKAANPDKDIRLVFMKADKLIRKGGALTYGGWAEKNGFPYAEGMIPEAWFQEKAKQ